MNINSYKLSNKSHLRGKSVSFSGSPAAMKVGDITADGQKFLGYKVQNMTLFKKAIPTISFVGSVMAALGYMTGSLGLFYDLKVLHDRGEKPVVHLDKDGAKTIEPKTKIGQNCMKIAKVGLFGSSLAGITCGIGEGLPMMSIGNTTEAMSVPIIETPIGTGLFGLAMASVFAALALDNTPEKKLNLLKVMAAKTPGAKAGIVAKNIGSSMMEVVHSLVGVGKNCYKPSFWKENFLHLTPKYVVFDEAINKAGKSTINAALRHNRNYMMHIASFILGVGGVSLALSKAFDKKEIQRNCLRVEEGGFLLDNIGMTRYGLDKFTVGKTAAGTNFALGGVINAISQFMGLDNQDGRAVQWFGIAMVFAGYAVDRGKFMFAQFKDSKQRGELSDVVRHWKFDISKMIPDKKQAKEFIKQMKQIEAHVEGAKVTNSTFVKLKDTVQAAIDSANSAIARNQEIQKFEKIAKTAEEKAALEKKKTAIVQSTVEAAIKRAFGQQTGESSPSLKFELDQFESISDTVSRLNICSEKVFGKNPVKVFEAAAKKMVVKP